MRPLQAAPTNTINDVISQVLPTPFNGQHVGLAFADINGDGAQDLLLAAGRHWIDQSYALINLGKKYNENGVFVGVRFSEALAVGEPGGYYQIDVAANVNSHRASSSPTSQTTHSVLLVGGTCHYNLTNSFGTCQYGENTPARVLEVTMNSNEGCSIHNPDAECSLEWREVWADPSPEGDRNGGFAYFGDENNDSPSVVLLGQGGIEVFNPVLQRGGETDASTSYVSAYTLQPPPATDPRSDLSRYAGFGAGKLPNPIGGVIAAGRRSDWDKPQLDDGGHIRAINTLLYYEEEEGGYVPKALPSTGEPYHGNTEYSLQSTNYAFADINGDGVQDLLEATFLYHDQLVEGYPLPQRIHFMNENAEITESLVAMEDKQAGRSVTTGQLYSDSRLPDVVFASARGEVDVFANLGVNDETGLFLGLEKRRTLSIGNEGCQIRDVLVVPMDEASCWMGIVCAVACEQPRGEKEPELLGKNHIFYLEGGGKECNTNVGDTREWNGALASGKLSQSAA